MIFELGHKKTNSQICGCGIFYEIALRRMPLDLTEDKFNISSGNGLVPSGNKLLPEPMLTQIYGVTRPQWVIMSSFKYHSPNDFFLNFNCFHVLHNVRHKILTIFMMLKSENVILCWHIFKTTMLKHLLMNNVICLWFRIYCKQSPPDISRQWLEFVLEVSDFFPTNPVATLNYQMIKPHDNLSYAKNGMVLRNDKLCEYVFIFPEINSTWQSLCWLDCLVAAPCEIIFIKDYHGSIACLFT